MNLQRTWIVLLLLLVACSEPGPLDTTQSTATYRHSMDGAPGSLDPAHASSIYANFLAVNIFDTLYRYKYLARPYEITPNLAAGPPELSKDGLVYTVTLRDDASFSDHAAFSGGRGRKVTANDFVYSIKRHFDPETRARGAWMWQGRIKGLDQWKENGSDYDQAVEGLRSLDAHTVRIELTRPFPQLVHTLAQGFSAIVPREVVEALGGEFANQPVGSGPFTLQDIDNARAVLTPRAGFREQPFSLAAEGYDPETQGGLGLESLEGKSPPFLDRLQIDFIAEGAARWNAYMSGNIDFIKVPVSQFEQVVASTSPFRLNPDFGGHRFESSLESGFVYTNFNLDDPLIGYDEDPVQNERKRALRCAIRKGFDWPARNDVFFSGIGKVFPGVIPPVSSEFDPNQDQSSVTFDPAGARDLLAEFGWNDSNLPELEYGLPSSVTERQMFEQFRGFMVNIGWPHERIKSRIFATYGDYLRAYSNREVMLITSSWTMDYPDAENTIQLYYGPNASPGSNSSNYNNPEYDALYRRSSAMQPSAERTELYRKMNELLIRDCATISGLSRRLLFLWNPDAIMWPDRSFVGGFFLRFVDMNQTAEERQ